MVKLDNIAQILKYAKQYANEERAERSFQQIAKLIHGKYSSEQQSAVLRRVNNIALRTLSGCKNHVLEHIVRTIVLNFRDIVDLPEFLKNYEDKIGGDKRAGRYLTESFEVAFDDGCAPMKAPHSKRAVEEGIAPVQKVWGGGLGEYIGKNQNPRDAILKKY